MNPIEKTIRTALERGDAGDRAFREKVYRSVFAALEKNIAANPDLTDDVVEYRREMLKSSIRVVESEFIPAFAAEEAYEIEEIDDLPDTFDIEESLDELPEEEVPAPPPPKPPVRRRASQSSWTAASNRYYQDEQEAQAPRAAPARTIPVTPRPAPKPKPRMDEPIPLPVIEPRHPRIPSKGGRVGLADPGFGDLGARRHAPMGRIHHRQAEPARKRGRIFIVLFLAVTLLAAGTMGIWWIVDQGLFRSAEERDTRVPNPPLTLEDEEFRPADPPPLSEDKSANGGDEWVTVFTPTDPTRVITSGGGTAQVIDIEGGVALRIRSTSADEPVRFEIGEGILQRIAGRRAVFNIRARTEPGKETQILVTCGFGPLGDCGRNRYFVSSENRDFAVGRDMPDARPTGAGAIDIVTDLANGGRSVDIIEIRVALSE